MKNLLYFFALLMLLSPTQMFAQGSGTLELSINPVANGVTLKWNGVAVTPATILPFKNSNATFIIYQNVTSPGLVVTLQNGSGDKQLVPVPDIASPPQNYTLTNGKDNTLEFGKDDTLIVKYSGVNKVFTFKTDLDPFTATVAGDKGKPSAVAPTGIAYYDALLLDSLRKTKDTKSVVSILLAYAELDSNGGAVVGVKNNKHLDEYFKDHLKSNNLQSYNPNRAQMGGKPNIGSILSSGISAVGGLDVTTIADGIAKFLVQRTKEELSVAFFTRFQDAISKDEYKDMQTIFPQTYRTLSVLGNEIYQYEAYIMVLRESFEKDLRTLPSNLPGIIDNHPDFFNNQPELKAILESAFYLAQQFQDKQHPGEIIANYPLNTLNNLDPNYKAGMLTLQLVSASLHSNSGDNYWINTTELKKVFSNESAFKVYLGLLTENAKKKNITFIAGGNNLPLYAMLDTLYDVIQDADAYKAFIKGFAEQASALDKKIASLKSADSDSMKVENYYSFFVSTIDLIRYTYKLEELPGLKGKVHLKETIEKYVEVAQTAANIVVDVNRRNYASAVVNVTMLYNRINKYSTPAAAKAYTTVNKKDYSLSDVMNNVLRYGSFMATITQAKTSDDVANAIEAFALPSGSARIKRETAFNVSLNAYVGGFAGTEKIQNVDKNPQFTSGITAPVGIAISTGGRRFTLLPYNRPGHWSYSLFVSVIDLGAITAFRFQNDSIEQVPTIKLENIFSPGLFLSIGIPKTPISINGGVQIGPNLRQVNSTGTNDVSDNLYVRWSASICVDIPVFNFYTKSK